MFLGWYDPDRKKPARAKLAEAIERYEEKFGRKPRFCLTSPQVKIRARDFIARWTFYIGEDAGEPAEQPAHRAAA